MSDFNTQQLAKARAAAWHQNGEALLTLESARDWLDGFGLVLYAPRPTQIPAPAPSLIEAALGASNAVPSLAETEQGRELLVRLVAEGAAIPLNLLGGIGDVPDFVVSTKLFSFLFTLRGDKAWKQPPVASGTVHVSQLAVNAYQALTERGDLTTAELVHELGREVTEAAVLRSLTELWGHLRVFPVPQADGAATKWELATRRFTKQIKAGINAGLPTALSALISVYLGQSIAASEEETEVFLSPLIARSRIREVLHALLAGRQLETAVLEGKTLLHIAGELPEFEPIVDPNASPTDEAVSETGVAGEATAEGATTAPSVPQPRISKFEGKKFEGRKFEGGGARDRERRPFQRDRAARPSFTKPWDEGKKPQGGWTPSQRRVEETTGTTQPAGEEVSLPAQAGSEGESRPPRRESEGRPPRREFGGGGSDRPRRTFGDKPKFGAKPFRKFDKPGGSGEGERRPFRPEGEGRPPSREFGGGGSDRPRRSFGDKPSFGAKPPFRKFEKREGSSGERERRPFTRDGESRPPRQDFGGDRPRRSFGDKPSFGGKPPFRKFDKPGGFGGGEKRPFNRDGESRPPRRDFGGDRPPRKDFGGDRPRRSFGDKPSFGAKPPFRKFDKPGGFGGGEKRPFTRDGESRPPRRDFGGDRPPRKDFGGDRPRRSFGDKPSFGGKPPFRKFDKPSGFGGGEKRPFNRDGESRPPRRDFGGDGPPRRDFGGDRPRRSFGDKPSFGAKPFRKPEGASSGGTDRPFRKPAFKSDKPGGFKKSFGGKPSFGGGKKFGGKPAGKFAGNRPGATRPPHKPEGEA